MGVHIESLINELRTILRNPPAHLQALEVQLPKPNGHSGNRSECPLPIGPSEEGCLGLE